MSRPHDTRPAHLQNPGRRKLLQAGAAGVTAALGSGAVSLVAREQQAQAPPAAPPGPPPAAGVLDPAALPAETWCEAWVWRPADWPGQSLELNVVERNEPTKAPSLGWSSVSMPAIRFARLGLLRLMYSASSVFALAGPVISIAPA